MRFVRAAFAALILMAALSVPALAGVNPADLTVTKTDAPDPVVAGSNLTWTITVENTGPSSATAVSMSDILPAGTTFVSFTTPAGWTATTPPVGGIGTVSATNPTLTVAAGAQVFTLVVLVDAATPNGTMLTNIATVAQIPAFADPDLTDNTTTSQTTVSATAPSVAASLADAATAQPPSGNPLAVLGFAVLLVAMLSASAVLAVRRVRS